ncbi:hypothetical protein D187_006198 [Cystobacter fuscus DSM 2262]|uniref:Uncharacterized protein n=1 Tax=Cystobacter fuscus (strain ATCC 25194 / DSM 2262 / NBRC 100088 / M29) TaxID=1242864 RepID=S9P2V5_CYSF2|nr:hypothetical protein D187_006198 [Cystobacter fuscus DSM 2262]
MPALGAVHDRLTDDASFEGEVRPDGTPGDTVQLPPDALVVTERVLEAAETLPAASLALTENE